jgi:hypothetical protein
MDYNHTKGHLFFVLGSGASEDIPERSTKLLVSAFQPASFQGFYAEKTTVYHWHPSQPLMRRMSDSVEIYNSKVHTNQRATMGFEHWEDATETCFSSRPFKKV